MVLEKLVKLDFDKRTGKIIIANTKQEAINIRQLSSVVVIHYPGCFGGESRLKIIGEKTPKDANAYLGDEIIFDVGGVVGGDCYHPVVYYKINEVQAKKSFKRKAIDSAPELQNCFSGDID